MKYKVKNSPLRVRIYQFVINYKTENDGNSPTLREIADACGASSISVVHYHLTALEDAGLISVRFHYRSRSITIIGGCWTLEKPN